MGKSTQEDMLSNGGKLNGSVVYSDCEHNLQMTDDFIVLRVENKQFCLLKFVSEVDKYLPLMEAYLTEISDNHLHTSKIICRSQCQGTRQRKCLVNYTKDSKFTIKAKLFHFLVFQTSPLRPPKCHQIYCNFNNIKVTLKKYTFSLLFLCSDSIQW